MKNILLLVHDDPGQEARLQVALDLVRAFNGHLQCLDVSILPHINGDVYGATAMLLEDEREREGANRARLQARLEREDAPWNWKDVTGDLGPSLTHEAKLADLIIVNRGFDTMLSPDMRQIAGRLLHDAKTPVLAVPDKATSLNVFGNALVAWDGSEAAGAALRAGVPLLEKASRVTVIAVGNDVDAASPDDAAAYLSRHGVHAQIVRVQAHDEDVGLRLLSEARNHAANYVVMGGYGHSRVREALIGGVTRTLLQNSQIPLFLAH